MKLLEQLPEKLLGWINRRNSFVKVIFSLGIIWTLITVIPGTITLIKHVEDFLINLHTPTGSPVIVSGGSLYGVVSPPKVTWVPISDSACPNKDVVTNITHCAHLFKGDSNLFSSVGFNPTVTSPPSTQSYWSIFFPDTTSASGLLLCSNPACSAYTGVPTVIPNDPHYIYIGWADTTNSQWETDAPISLNQLQYLFFHHKNDGCDNATSYGGSCDVLNIARVFITGKKPVSYACQHVASPGQCAIGIGDPAVQLSSAVALYKKLF